MKRSPLTIKKRIVSLLKEGEKSLRELDIKANCGYITIINQCKELEYLGIITITKYKKNPKTGRPYTRAKLTHAGKKIQ